jgi:hypothetical protein
MPLVVPPQMVAAEWIWSDLVFLERKSVRSPSEGTVQAMEILVLKKNGVPRRSRAEYRSGYDNGFIECRGDILDLVVATRFGAGRR